MTNRNTRINQESYRNRLGIRGGARGRGAREVVGEGRGGASTELLTTMTGGLHITCPQLLTDIVKIRGDPQHGFKSQRDLVISGSSLWFTDINTFQTRKREFSCQLNTQNLDYSLTFVCACLLVELV